MDKLPPIEKIYEAYTAIADNRVSISGNNATVQSSDFAKEYIVTFNDNIYTSTDSASFWQGYPGYPIIAVLMLQGKLSLNCATVEHFKAINWKQLNTKYKANYSKAVDEIMKQLKDRGVDTINIVHEADKVFDEIKKIDLIVKRGYKKRSKISTKKTI